MSDQIDEPEIPSTMPDISVKVVGIQNEYGAECLRLGTTDLVREIGRYLDISSLDGITVAVDYDEALRGLDRGIEGLRPEERTNDGGLVGVGKSVVVKRGDEFRTHIVLLADHVCVLAFAEEDRNIEDLRTALAIVSHECAHVEEHAERDRQFPGVLIGYRAEDYIGKLEQQFSESFWGEYAVCRASAPWARNQEQRYRENVATRLKDARSKALEAIRSYRIHGNVERVLQEAGAALLEPLRMASYLFGHLDGIAEVQLPDIASQLEDADPAIATAIAELVSQMRVLWDRRGQWESYDELMAMGRTGFKLISACGVHATPQPNGTAYINVP
ncbi:hypothetical protein G6L99_31575 [Agrobacterium rhizogenes]|uniref:hypothetical protein n=1 Tax=Rhizobium rhizogenes TaxID=359 RepID=UPI0015730AAF|nr:hypothetical protein [Rhizobium rhizogenes]NTH16655.1 hypothetical protein [Rhizobium rhizogenes]